MSVERAARNNAEWCEAVCAGHGRTTSFEDRLWRCDRPPRLYPDVVTLDPSTSVDEVLAAVDTTRPGRSVKDSFATIDLGPTGFRVLFDATWIWREPSTAKAREPEHDGWSTITNPTMLSRWRASADAPVPDALLDRPDVAVIARDGIDAGGVLNRSDGVVGLSNVFCPPGHEDAAWSACLGFAAARFPGLAVVGYETGVALRAAIRQGFEPLAPLRVWIHDG